MTYYGRDTWTEDAYPITGPAPKAPTTLPVVHYSASNNIPADKPQWLRNMQRDYTNVRGYSLGYWALVCQNGDAYQIRGPGPTPGTYNSAANAGMKVDGNANDWTAPILFDITTTEPISQAAIDTATRLWATWGLAGRPVPHSTLDQTSCCGDTARAQIANGQLDIKPTLPPEPPPTAPEGAPDMFLLVVTNGPDSPVAETWLVCDGTQLGHVVDGHAVPAYEAAGVEWIRSTGADQTRGVILSSRTTNGCPPEWRGTAWETLWEGQAI